MCRTSKIKALEEQMLKTEVGGSPRDPIWTMKTYMILELPVKTIARDEEFKSLSMVPHTDRESLYGPWSCP